MLPSFGNYSKFFNAAIGLAIGALITWAASAGFAVCTAAADGTQACTILGFSEAQITGAVMSLAALLFVHQSPPNNKG